MHLRVIEIASLGAFSVASLIANASTTIVSGWLFQFGALGLCAFMVVQNYRQSQALIKVINSKDVELKTLTLKLESTTKQSTHAMQRLAEALSDRPCMIGDSRTNPPNEES